MPGYPGFGDIPRVSIIALSDVFVSLKGHQAQLGDLLAAVSHHKASPGHVGTRNYGLFSMPCLLFFFPSFLMPFLLLQIFFCLSSLACGRNC